MSPSGGLLPIFLIFFSFLILPSFSQLDNDPDALTWNSTIQATEQQKMLEQSDALSKYFGQNKNDVSYFPTREEMVKRVGKFEDVEPSKLINHNYNNMTAWMRQLTLQYPNITYMYSIGKSVEGRDLWVLIVSDNPKKHEILEPEIKYVANMHGNEVVGRDALLFLAEILCKNYGTNEYLTSFVDNNRIHLLPSMNPDGYEIGTKGDRIGYQGRANAHFIDLNRNFPTMYPEHKESSGGGDPEPEVVAVMAWLKEHPFVISANLHGGSLVANYPFDDSVSGKDGIYTPSADDVLFVEMSYRYARAHANMWKTGRRCGLSTQGDTFINGITNGAGWYHLAGGMQDWQYLHTNCMEITIEMGCFKFPTDEMVPKLWEEHQMALLSFLELGRQGTFGLVTNPKGESVQNATVFIEGGKPVYTTEDGEYWRMLSPGKHRIRIESVGFEGYEYSVDITPSGKPVRRDVRLPECGSMEDKQKIINRGRGSIMMAVVGLNRNASRVLLELSRLLCSGEFQLDSDIQLAIVPILEGKEEADMLRSSNVRVVLAVADGFVESITFSKQDNQPKLFSKEKLDESLQKTLGYGAECDKTLRESAAGMAIDDLRLSTAFELGIALGCDDSVDKTKKAATIATTISMLRKTISLDSVHEYSVVPSANPSDHFTPADAMIVTSAAIPLLEEHKCLTEIEGNPSIKLYKMGTGKPPFTLVTGIEKRTETLVFEWMSRWCEQTHLEGVENILKQSTIIMMPEIPHTQLNCHDYGTVGPFQKLLSDVLHVVPQIDFIMMFASGGLKLRYINETSHDMAGRLAQSYKALHTQMQDTDTDTCNGGIPHERESIKEMSWTDPNTPPPVIQWSKPDTLLIQTGCCHESGVQHLYEENRRSIIQTMNERLKGMRFSSLDTGLAVESPAGVRYSVDAQLRSVFIPLNNGKHELKVYRGDKWVDTVRVKVTNFGQLVVINYKVPGSSNILVISIVSFMLLMACLFACRQRVSSVLNRRGFFTGSRKGFERIPLYKSDSEDEDDIFDLQKL